MYSQKLISRNWYLKNKNDPKYIRMIKSNKLKHRYGITMDDYDRLFAEQKGKCLICKEEKKLHVDHCHTTGEIRGLLCAECNNGLGCFKDNVILIDKAIQYLRRNG